MGTPPLDAPQLIPTGLSDLLIVGGGPVGLFAAFYAGMRQMSVKIIDSLQQLGGQLSTLYPEKYIYDVAGFPKVLAKELADNLIQQAMLARPAVALGEQVLALHETADGQGFVIETDRGRHAGRSILLAAGVGAFTPKRLPLPEADRYLGKGLDYFVQSTDAFRNQRVLIVGGGDSAVDWANALAPLATSVTLVHRRDVFRAHEGSVALLRAGPAELKLFHELRGLVGDGRVTGAVIEDTTLGTSHEIAADHVLVNIGFESSLGPIRHWGLDLDGSAIRVDHRMQTSRPGVFAAGDVCHYLGKLKLIATGFGEAATAVNFAKQYLDPKANLFPGHSTSVAEQRLDGLRK